MLRAQDPERCGAAAAIVGDKNRFAREIDGDFAGSAAAGGTRIDGFQLRPFNSKGRDGTAVFSAIIINLVDGVKMAAIGRKASESWD